MPAQLAQRSVQGEHPPMIVPSSQEHLSPSLRSSARHKVAFELKFLIQGTLALEIEKWLTGKMQLDPHCQESLGNAYRISTIYSDTSDFAVFHKAFGYAGRKFRLRRYDGHD